ncbi:MAG: alkaline phosphatase family protein [Janthinobacterium lividum]
MRSPFARLGALALFCVSCSPFSAFASAYDAKPKLVVILVIDQFRGDYLDRYRADFKTPNGFNLFLKQGAYFPNCYYDYADTETAPGHATIGTGAYADGHNIGVNQWWDPGRSTTHQVSSVEDAEFPLVGTTIDAALGASPRNELASTIGDEVVLSTGGKARVFGVSLKDRAAILTSGHATAGAFWLDHPTGHWISSTYWGPQLPGWVTAFNSGPRIGEARHEAGVAEGDFYEKVGATPAAIRYELDFAQALVTAEKLGHGEVTNVLTISISSTDILGHRVGPDAPEQRALIDALDVDLNGFFNWLDGNVDGGLNSVVVALTGDHGIAPRPAVAAAERMPAGVFSSTAVNAELEKELNSHYKTAQPVHFVLGGTLPYLQLDERAFKQISVGEAEAEELVADLLPGAMAVTQEAAKAEAGKPRTLRPATIRQVYTKTQLAKGDVPNTQDGRLMLHSYTSNGGWWVLVSPGMYELSGTATGGTNHFTPYSYDRHVPLAFFGLPFLPGTYLEQAAPVDIAATLAALLRVNRPTACVGRVVTEALRPVVNAR